MARQGFRVSIHHDMTSCRSHISRRRTHYHSKAFREDEKRFYDPDAEKKLAALVRRERMRWW